MISAPPLSLSQIGYAIVLLCLVCFVGSLYLGFRVWNGHVTVTGLFLSNENTIGPAIDLLALVLREASRDRR